MDKSQDEKQKGAITGYRELGQSERALINMIKGQGEDLHATVARLAGTEGFDQRWVSIGRTHLQQGIMALVRAIAQPTTF